MTQINLTSTIQKHCLWLSLLCHLLMLLSFTVVLVFQDKPEDKPELYIPSYTYHEVQPIQSATIKQTQTEAKEKKENAKVAKGGIKKSNQAAKTSTQQQTVTKSTPQPNLSATDTINTKTPDGVHIVGNKKLDKPLIKILGSAISRTLIYPRVALDIGLRGTSYVGFTLRPDGFVTNVHIVKSSNTGVLDDEAVRAISAISPVREVAPYVKEPTYLIVGIIFG